MRGMKNLEIIVGKATIGFQPQTMVVPIQSPIRRENTVCLVIRARMIAVSGGMRERKPYSMIKSPPRIENAFVSGKTTINRTCHRGPNGRERYGLRPYPSGHGRKLPLVIQLRHPEAIEPLRMHFEVLHPVVDPDDGLADRPEDRRHIVQDDLLDLLVDIGALLPVGDG